MARVSVVLIFLNEERFLAEAVESVLDQTETDWELILVDDGSTDRSTQIAREFASRDRRVHYVDHPDHENRGMAASRNLGASKSSAPYLGFIDGDDVWVPTKLSEQIDILDRMPDVAMVNGALLYWHSWDPSAAKEDRLVLTGGYADECLDPPRIALTAYPLGSADGAGVDLLVRRNTFESVGGFEERFRGIYEDQSFLMKIFLRHTTYISSRAWIRYRQHRDSECARTDDASYLRVRIEFLDWLQGEVKRLSDRRVSAALRRARRTVRYRKLLFTINSRWQAIVQPLRNHAPSGWTTW